MAKGTTFEIRKMTVMRLHNGPEYTQVYSCWSSDTDEVYDIIPRSSKIFIGKRSTVCIDFSYDVGLEIYPGIIKKKRYSAVLKHILECVLECVKETPENFKNEFANMAKAPNGGKYRRIRYTRLYMSRKASPIWAFFFENIS